MIDVGTPGFATEPERLGLILAFALAAVLYGIFVFPAWWDKRRLQEAVPPLRNRVSLYGWLKRVIEVTLVVWFWTARRRRAG